MLDDRFRVPVEQAVSKHIGRSRVVAELRDMDELSSHPDVFEGYREILPIDSGFSERRDLWRLPGYLAVIEVEGSSFVPGFASAVNKYL